MIFTLLLGLLPLLGISQALQVSDGTQCGGVLTASNGSIAYKEFTPLAPNERCTWIIRMPNATMYYIHVKALEFFFDNKTDTKLIFAGLSSDNYPDIRTPTHEGNIYMHNSSVILVTLISGSFPNGAKGFQIYYEGDYDGVDPTSSESKDVFTNTDLGHIRHPANSNETIDYRDLSTFIFSPLGNLYDDSRLIDVTYSKIRPSNDCHYLDNLRVYYLNHSSNNTNWDFMGTICGYTKTTKLQSKDMILVMFRSNRKYTSDESFEFTYCCR